jgi:transcriptional regulator with XRE-family HTH domain
MRLLMKKAREDRRKAIGLRLKESRLASGFTQEEIAVHLELKAQTVSSWERGKSMPKADEWYALGPLLGVSLDYLVYGIRTIPVGQSTIMGAVFRPTTATV